ncbi:RNA polymerase sigma factor [Silvibacterium acidisoli]|uniref:RNA polymerase sigma factor n=1 Tax=Acidobacteriaceae bacterium ZG23-2 TaxID=2883246 RepID=UPI00406C56E0
MIWRGVRAEGDALASGIELCPGLESDPPSSTSFLRQLRNRFLSDEELAAELGRGNADALTALFKRHGALVFCIARRILRNDAEAEDTVQQVFLDVYRAIRRFDPAKASFKSWLMMFAYQRMFNSRRTQMSSRFFDTDTYDDELCHAGCATHPVADNAILVEQVLRLLSPRQKRTIELVYREGLTADEVAARTGESVRVVRHNLYRGLDKLRKALGVAQAVVPRTTGRKS